MLAVCTCVNADADPTCSVTASGVAFGNCNPLASQNSDSTGSVGVTCIGSTSVSYTIAASAGAGSYSTRQQVSGSHTLNYNIFTDSSRKMVWGDGISSGTNAISGSMIATSTGATESYTVYGRIFSGQQTAWVGSYSDILTVTIAY
ncbi:spore coat U domain-containing protein [Paraburkholderia tagetis]|uniref:Spore coat U domain-containing protein n=1 Tax=Paraburkholderia tagetis TaxID=2913261 RepID=A0A9X1RVX1_9BURK|nr:spore coat U domain-containing protein [Paraburkholderia tagetis]MCG5077091.1 spore coat U domain-containing protein [Paraburkholderia tagetis]